MSVQVIEIIAMEIETQLVNNSKGLQQQFFDAVEANDIAVVQQLLLDPAVDPSAKNNFAIEHAAALGYVELVKLLLADIRIDPTDNDNRTLYLAAHNGHTAVIKVLLADHRIDPSNSELGIAAANGHVAVVKLLLADDRIDPTTRNNSIVRWAADFNRIEVVKLLLADDRVIAQHVLQQHVESDVLVNTMLEEGYVDKTSVTHYRQLKQQGFL